MRSLGGFEFGKNSMNALISEEAMKLKEFLVLNCNKSFALNLTMNTAIINSLWTIDVGEPLGFNDPVVRHSVETIDKAIKNSSHMHPIIILFPRLQTMFSQYFGFDYMSTAVTMLKTMINQFTQHHEETFDPEHIRDLLDLYIY